MTDTSWTCYHCGEAVAEGATSCSACGDSLVELCICGTTRSTVQKACPNCDRRIRRRKYTGRRRYLYRRYKRSLVIAVVLAGVALLAWNVWMMLPEPVGQRIAAGIGRGRDAIKRKDPRAAEISLRQVLEISPDNTEALELLALALQDLGRQDEAVEVARRAVALDKTRRVALLLIAADDLVKGDYVGARSKATESLKLGAETAARLLLGRIEAGVGDVDRAIEHYRSAGLEDSSEIGAFLDLADLYLTHPRGTFKHEARMRYGQALTRCNAQLDAKPDAAGLLWKRARARVGLGTPEDLTMAVADLRRVAGIRAGRGQDSIPARLKIVRIFAESLGTPEGVEQAKQAARALVQEQPDPRTHLALARVLQLAGETEEARESLDRGIESFPRNAELRGVLVMLLAESGEIEQALRVAALAAAQTEDEPEVCIAQARVYEMAAGKEEEAEKRDALLVNAGKAYARALAKRPQDLTLRRRLVDIFMPRLLERGGDDEPVVAKTDLEAEVLASVDGEAGILKLRPGDPQASYWRGRLRYRAAKSPKEFAVAAVDLDRAGSVYRRSVDVNYWRGMAHTEAVENALAAQAFLLAVKALPPRIGGRAGRIYLLLANARLNSGRAESTDPGFPDGAIDACDEALARWPAFPERRRVLIVKARALDRVRRSAEALAVAREAHAMAPNDIAGILLLARMLEQAGDTSEAERRYVEAVALRPDAETQGELARFLADQGKIERGKKIHEDLLARNPGSTKVKIAYGEFLRRFGKRDDAIAILRDAMERDPASTVARVRLADVLLAGGKAEMSEPARKKEIEEARMLVKQARDGAPEHPDGLLLAAKIELMDRRPQEAHDLLLRALSQRPRDPSALYYFGLSLVKLKRVAAARGPLEKAIGFDPGLDQARLLLARIELTEGYLAYREHRSEAAAVSFRKALAHDPSLRFARVLLADTYLDRNMRDLSIQEVREMLAALPDDGSEQARRDRAAGLFLLGFAALQGATREDGTKDATSLDEAVNAFREVARLEPKSWRGHFQLGRAYEMKGASGMALSAFGDAYQHAPGLPVIVFAIVHTLMATGEVEKARNLLVNTTEEYTKIAEFPHMLGDVFRQTGQPDLAMTAYATARERDPTDIEAILTPARMLLHRGRRVEAFDLVKKWIPRVEAANGSPAPLHRWLGEIAYERGDDELAVVHLDRAVASGERDPRAALRLGQALERRREFDGAIKAYELAIQMGLDDFRVHGKLGDLLLMSGNWHEAALKYELVLEATPDDLDARNNLALALADAGRDLERALALAESVLDERKDDPSVKDTLGWVLLRRGDPERGLTLFNEALRRLPASPEINFHRAVAWTMTPGKQERGREELRRLQTSGVSKTLQKRIRRVLGGR